MTDDDWPECICEPLACKKECEVCAETGSCIPVFLEYESPTEKDQRREKYRRRNGQTRI
jgi:hypothetical protein